jgi:predicted TIM-barrel fold metal-dependent hydrolase
MWIRKFHKDDEEDTRSPIPTQVVSNEEFIPRPQTLQQKKVESLIQSLAEKCSKQIGLTRRDFLKTTNGMAVAFIAMNEVFGKYFNVQAEEMIDPDAIKELWPNKEFIFDVQTHHVATGKKEPLGFRVMAWPFNDELKGKKPQKGDLNFNNYVKEVFLDSDVSVACLSGVASRVLDVINVDEMVEARNTINEMSGSERMVCHGPIAPYTPNFLQEAERQALDLNIDAWKFYPGVFNTAGEYNWWLDDEDAIYPFYEKIQDWGKNIVCVHKGLPFMRRLKPGQSDHTHPRDIKKASLDHPGITFVIYHSAFKDENQYLSQEDEYLGDKAYLPYTTDLCKDRIDNPNMTNVFMELGTSFGHTVITHPKICAHLLGQIIQAFGADHILFGTDSIWWGSPQWQIEAFRRFQIPIEMQEKFGYAAISDEDKAKILGLNAAKLYGINVEERRQQLVSDRMTKIKEVYLAEGGSPSNNVYGWVMS